MRVLVTSSRMPFALDAIRKLGERGHEVFACDSYEASPGSHSNYLRRALRHRLRHRATPSSSPPTSSGSPTTNEIEVVAADVRGGLLPRRAARAPLRGDEGSTRRPSGRSPRCTTRAPSRSSASGSRSARPQTVLAHSPDELERGDRAASRATSPAPPSRGAAWACSPTPGRSPATSRSTTATRPRRTRGWCRSSSTARCTAPTPAFIEGGSPRTCPTARRASGSTRPGSSSSRSIRRTRCRRSRGSGPSSPGTGRCRSTSSRPTTGW